MNKTGTSTFDCSSLQIGQLNFSSMLRVQQRLLSFSKRSFHRDTSNLPLHGVRILDCSRVLAGPFATQFLGDLGCEVIKIEQPGRGDDTRQWKPPQVSISNSTESLSAYFLSANRNKKSVTIDFSKPQGAALVQQLAKQSHVFIENFKVGGLKKYGLDCESLQKVNPSLIYCSITSFGQESSKRSLPGYDFIAQAMSGLVVSCCNFFWR